MQVLINKFTKIEKKLVSLKRLSQQNDSNKSPKCFIWGHSETKNSRQCCTTNAPWSSTSSKKLHSFITHNARAVLFSPGESKDTIRTFTVNVQMFCFISMTYLFIFLRDTVLDLHKCSGGEGRNASGSSWRRLRQRRRTGTGSVRPGPSPVASRHS